MAPVRPRSALRSRMLTPLGRYDIMDRAKNRPFTMSPAIIHEDVVRLAESRVGMVLRDKYRLDSVIGVGGMASVYAATHRNGARVAVKLLHPEVCASAEVRTRFLREGYVANSIEHQGVVKVLDDDTDDRAGVFLVMELLQGSSLETLRENAAEPMSEEFVLSTAYWLLDIIEAAHARGVLHRDIKPDNVFLTDDGLVKLLDFGIARMREFASSATRSGTALGTPAFMPPEQALGHVEEVDGRSDVFAVGAVMFTLLSGRYVHEGTTPTELLVASATKAAPLLRSVAPGVSELVAEIVDRALRFKKSERWESAAAMKAEVEFVYLDDEAEEEEAATTVFGARSVPIPAASQVRQSAQPAPREPAPVVHIPAENAVVEASRASLPSYQEVPAPLPFASSVHTPSPQAISTAGMVAPGQKHTFLIVLGLSLVGGALLALLVLGTWAIFRSPSSSTAELPNREEVHVAQPEPATPPPLTSRVEPVAEPEDADSAAAPASTKKVTEPLPPKTAIPPPTQKPPPETPPRPTKQPKKVQDPCKANPLDCL